VAYGLKNKKISKTFI